METEEMKDFPSLSGESNFSFAAVAKRAGVMSNNSIILANLCGRGDKDIFTVAEKLGVEI